MNKIANLELSDAELTVAIFSSCIAIVLAVIYYLLRLGFNNPVLPILGALSLSFFLLFFAQVCRYIFHCFGLTLRKTWYTTHAFFSVVGLFVLLLFGFLVPVFSFQLFQLMVIAFSIIGFVFFIGMFAIWLYRGHNGPNFIFIMITILFAVWVAGSVWGSGYQNPLFEENIVIGKAMSVMTDTLFHSSITHMIKTYGIPSTGIDMLPYIHYHIGSHWIFAQVSNLLNMSPIHFYQLGYPIIFIPFYFSSILNFVINLKENIQDSIKDWTLRSDVKLWLIFIIAQIGFLPFTGFYKFISESYTVGLICTFLLLTIGLSFARSINNKHLSKNAILFVCILPLFLGIIGLIKISLMILMFALSIYVLLRLKLYKRGMFFISFVLITLITVIVFSYYSPSNSGGAHVFLFNSILHSAQNPYIRLFYPFYYFWSALTICLILYSRGFKITTDLKNSILNNEVLDLEIIVLFCIVGAVPGLILSIYGGSDVYFSDFQKLISVALLLASLDIIVKKYITRGKDKVSLGCIKMNGIYLIILFVASCGFLYYYAKPIRQMLVYNMNARILLSGKNLTEKERYEMNKKKYLLDVLHNLATIPLQEKKKSLLFIPQSKNKLYWNLVECGSVSFVAPAISGIAMIDGLPEVDCKVIGGGYSDYKLRKINQLPVNEIKNGLCSKAFSNGFQKIISIEVDADNIYVRNLCSNTATQQRP